MTNTNSLVPAMARIESGSAFHVFAAKYRKDLRPCLVLLTLGNESMFVPLKLYFVSFTLSRFTMGVGVTGSMF